MPEELQKHLLNAAYAKHRKGYDNLAEFRGCSSGKNLMVLKSFECLPMIYRLFVPSCDAVVTNFACN